MASTSDFKNGLVIVVDNEPYQITWFQNHKPGKGGAVMRVKLRHVKKGGTIDRTFKSGEKFETLSVSRQKKQFLYIDGGNYNFMDMNSYEQFTIPKEKLDGKEIYLKENQEVEAIYLEDDLIGIDMPLIIEMTIIEAEPGIKGDSVTNLTKFAKIESGAEIKVPLFIKVGDRIKVDTRTGEYVERVSQ
ncbi:MAG: elongation factor P [Endomicrobiaceae bacterium]|nr:elongation factor P [Endomicrobiaceae bacterium]